MKKLFLFVAFISLTSINLFSQGTLRGKITDENGETLFGVRIFLKNNKTIFTSTDFDGNYSLKIAESTPQTIVVSYTSFETIEEIIKLANNEVLIKDFTLEPEASEIKEVSVVVKKTKAKEYYMENVKKNSATTIDYISSETMKKTGDANVATAVARVSGVSTNGGIITVRGIGDRYVKTTLNGSRIPTLDPLTNNIKLDIFPSSLIDNIIITKTASPDLPGDFTGAYLSVETKDYPEKLEVNVESQFGYNNQTSFKDVISSQRSKTDWLGFDNDLRQRQTNDLISPNLDPTTYQEMVALGLENYFTSIGVNNSNFRTEYFKLGLIELGLLPTGLYNDPAAVAEATTQYNEIYKPQAFNKINPEGKDYNNGFSNNWNTLKRKAPLNFTQSFSVGNQVKLFGKPFGYLIGFRYANSMRYDPNGTSQRIGAEELGFPFDVQDDAQISRETNGWSGLCNLSYKMNDKNSVSLLFMPNYTGVNDVASFSTMTDKGWDEGRVSKNQFYEQRHQLIYQFKSEHFIAGPKMKIESNASYTQGKSIAPDFKVLQYGTELDSNIIIGYQFAPNAGDGIRRFYRYLTENILDTRLSAELPLTKKESSLVRKLKFGGAYQNSSRKSDMDEFMLRSGNGVTGELTSDDIDTYLNPSHFIMDNKTIDYFYTQNDAPRNHSIGSSSILAGFVLADYEIVQQIRLAGGLRVEKAKLFSDVLEYHEKGYERNDVRRENVGGFQNINAANIDEVNFLPSANLIYKFKNEKFAQVNVRLNYSQTVARPSIRELNDLAIYDNEFRTLLYGNSDLKTVHIQNYDFRAESYFKNGDNASISFFYKDFKNHIEMGFGNSGVTWSNIDNSYVVGFEFEGKKSITKSFELRANVTLVKSESEFVRTAVEIIDGVKIISPIDTVLRPMFGQAPYIVNAIASYKADSIGLVATVSYNIQGPRLVITGIIKGRPDVYELPRNTLDFKVSKTLGKHFSTSLTVRDILNAPVVRAYKLPDSWVDFDRFRYGTNFVLGVSYKI